MLWLCLFLVESIVWTWILYASDCLFLDVLGENPVSEWTWILCTDFHFAFTCYLLNFELSSLQLIHFGVGKMMIWEFISVSMRSMRLIIDSDGFYGSSYREKKIIVSAEFQLFKKYLPKKKKKKIVIIS